MVKYRQTFLRALYSTLTSHSSFFFLRSSFQICELNSCLLIFTLSISLSNTLISFYTRTFLVSFKSKSSNTIIDYWIQYIISFQLSEKKKKKTDWSSIKCSNCQLNSAFNRSAWFGFIFLLSSSPDFCWKTLFFSP